MAELYHYGTYLYLCEQSHRSSGIVSDGFAVWWGDGVGLPIFVH